MRRIRLLISLPEDITQQPGCWEPYLHLDAIYQMSSLWFPGPVCNNRNKTMRISFFSAWCFKASYGNVMRWLKIKVCSNSFQGLEVHDGSFLAALNSGFCRSIASLHILMQKGENVWDNLTVYVNPSLWQGFIWVLSNSPKLSRVFASGHVNTKQPFSISFIK